MPHVAAMRMFQWCAVMAALMGMGACKPKPAPAVDPLVRLPATCMSAVFGSSLGEASKAVAVLVQQLERPGKGPAPMPNLSTEIAAAIGFDGLSEEGLKTAGWNPAGGFAIGWDVNQGVIMVLPVQDAATAGATLARVARQLEQADRVKEEMVGPVKVVTYARPFGSREVPALSVALLAPHMVVTWGRTSTERMKAVLAVTAEQSLARGPVMVNAGVPPTGMPLSFVLTGGAAADIPWIGPVASTAVHSILGGARVDAQSVEVATHARLKAEKRDAVMATLFPPGTPLSALGMADADAWVVGQGSLLQQSARQMVEAESPGGFDALQKQAQRVGLAVDANILDLTDGHYAGALYLAPPEELAAMLTGRSNVRKELMRVVPFVVAMRAKAGTTAQALLDQLVANMKSRNIATAADPNDPLVMVAGSPGTPAWRTWKFAAVGDVVVLGGGLSDHFENALKRLRKTAPATAWVPHVLEVLAVKEQRTSTLLLRGEAVVQRLDQVLAGNLGDSAEALMARSLLGKIRASLLRMQDVLVEMSPEAEGVKGRLKLRWTAEQP